MKSRLMSFGHTASHEPITVQLPNPSSSIALTILTTRRSFSTPPCGSRFMWDTFAATNNIAEAFLHAPTHAPQPMQAAASIDLSAIGLGIGIVLPSGVPPVETEI